MPGSSGTHRTSCCPSAPTWSGRRAVAERFVQLNPSFTRSPDCRRFLVLHPGAELVRDATMIAVQAGHSVYDCFYIACAKQTDSILVTADRRLAEIVPRWAPSVTAVTLEDGDGMAAIEAAGVRLIISPESVGELIQAWDPSCSDGKKPSGGHLRRGIDRRGSDHHAGTRRDGRELRPDIATYRRLLRLIRTLEHEERVDLLVLGWLGRDERMTRRRLLDHAIRMVDQLSVHYIAYLGAHWRAGQARVAGQEPT
ncbi:type II toxin-antitoxin system VapC family toxin [Candidatus Palauibacter sp.]|uniref:type II toxin-antitoxin system VapC family toxin n=1 Tax=Candidatus Palauibacter sp. TaxID=3101350 RepID=UPI003AF2BB2C